MRRLALSSKIVRVHSQPAIPSYEDSPASRPGPVQAERSEPEGSLDGWPRCHILRDEGMAGCLGPASTLKGPRLHRPASIRTFFQPRWALCQLGSANLTGAAS